MDEQVVEVLSATTAAERLGVSASGLRRLGTIYAQVHGELSREPTTDKRIWTSEVVERLAQARALLDVERYRSIKEALEALDKGVDVDVATDLAQAVEPPPQALEMLVRKLGQLEARFDGVERLEAEVQALRRQLSTPDRTAELERMNAYLLGELERRRLEIAPVKRPWWRLWR